MRDTGEQDYERWADGLTIEGIRQRFLDLGCELVLVKVMGPNNNSKQQVYLANHLNELASIPFGPTQPKSGTSRKRGEPRAIFHCALDLSWLGPKGAVPAPNTKLIYYPQYPEVRLSGFLQGCAGAPSHLMRIEARGKEPGRLLLLGVNPDSGQVHGLAVGGDTALARAVLEMRLEQRGVLHLWRLSGLVAGNPRNQLLAELCSIALKSWVAGQRLTRRGLVPYRAPNGGGYTIEALLGVVSNADAVPDCHGYEIKQFNVGNLDRPRSKDVSLFDTVPDGGEFRRLGVGDFIRAHGHHNTKLNRFDFAGRHRIGFPPPRTGARLELTGYDGTNLRSDGAVALVGSSGTTLMEWSFAKLVDHWGRKHALAAYVPSESRDVVTSEGTSREYRYGQTVQLGTGTDFTLFLEALRQGAIKFDPGMHAPESPKQGRNKVRSLFRIGSSELSILYEQFQSVDTCLAPSGSEFEVFPTPAS